jgi:hypothetical protein
MNSDEFARQMTRLTQQSDWAIAYNEILAEIKTNDPRLNALINYFVQITPKTQSELRMMTYFLFISMKMLALDHLGLLQNYTFIDVIGNCTKVE